MEKNKNSTTPNLQNQRINSLDCQTMKQPYISGLFTNSICSDKIIWAWVQYLEYQIHFTAALEFARYIAQNGMFYYKDAHLR